MLVAQLLLETLEDLTGQDFSTFKWFLTLNVLMCCNPMAKSCLESPHRHDTVSKMIERYGDERAVNVTVEILSRMKHNKAAQKLKKTYTGAVDM